MGLTDIVESSEGFAERGFLTTTVDSVMNWARTGS
jgi:hypothetical protein